MKTVLALFVISVFSTVHAELIIVDTNGDNELGDLDCELRSAILAANDDSPVEGCLAGSGPDTIEFAITGSVQLDSDLPDITEDLIINGPGLDQLTIDGNNLSRQFVFAPASGSHEVRDLTLSQGMTASFGGCLRTDATHVLIQDMVFTACQSGVIGGALLAAADTEIERVLFFENTAAGGSGGGAILTNGTHIVRSSSFVSNNALGGTSNGGGLGISTADVTVSASTFAANSADQHGGGIALYGTGSLSVISSSVSDNTANAEQSGAGHGGGVFVQSGSLVLENTVISGNEDKSSAIPIPQSGFLTCHRLTSPMVAISVRWNWPHPS